MKLAPLPLLAGPICFLLWRGADRRSHATPYLYAVCLFLVGYVGLAISLWPYIVPFAMTPGQAAAADNALALMLWGAGPMLPIILGYGSWRCGWRVCSSSLPSRVHFGRSFSNSPRPAQRSGAGEGLGEGDSEKRNARRRHHCPPPGAFGATLPRALRGARVRSVRRPGP